MQIVVLVNPAASPERADIYRQLCEFNHPELEIIVPQGSDYLQQATQMLRAGADALLVIGGDGTINDATQLLAGSDTKLLVVPAGTGNDFAKGMRIHHRTTAAQLMQGFKALAAGDYQVQPLTALRLTARTSSGKLVRRGWAVNSVNIGFDAQVNRRANSLQRLRGPLRYLAAMLLEIPGFKAQRFNLSVAASGALGEPASVGFGWYQATLICLQNGPFIGGGIPLAPQAAATAATMWVSLVGKLPRLALLALFPLLYLRGHRLIRPLEQWHGTAARVSVPPGVSIYVDGDAWLEDPPQQLELEVTAVPEALQLVRFS